MAVLGNDLNQSWLVVKSLRNKLKWKCNQTTVDLSNKCQFVVLSMVGMWHHLSCLSLVQAMACCLTASSRYQNQCWFTMHRILMNTPQYILCGNTVYQWQECCVYEWCLIIYKITWNDFQPLRFPLNSVVFIENGMLKHSLRNWPYLGKVRGKCMPSTMIAFRLDIFN